MHVVTRIIFTLRAYVLNILHVPRGTICLPGGELERGAGTMPPSSRFLGPKARKGAKRPKPQAKRGRRSRESSGWCIQAVRSIPYRPGTILTSPGHSHLPNPGAKRRIRASLALAFLHQINYRDQLLAPHLRAPLCARLIARPPARQCSRRLRRGGEMRSIFTGNVVPSRAPKARILGEAPRSGPATAGVPLLQVVRPCAAS